MRRSYVAPFEIAIHDTQELLKASELSGKTVPGSAAVCLFHAASVAVARPRRTAYHYIYI
jgi:hypothetical protein